MFGNMTIRTKAVLAGIASVVVSVLVTTAALLTLTRAELVRQANEFQNVKMRTLHELLRAKGEPRIQDGKLVFGSYVANGNYEVVDKLVSLAGGTATIFEGDTRVSTNVMKDDGTRAVGTPLVGPAKEATINRAQPYRGAADILGIPYFTAYDPILDADGKPMGVLYVGVKQEEFLRSFRHLGLSAGAVALTMALVFGFLVSVITGRVLGRIAQLARTATDVSMGERLEDPLTNESTDEIGDLTRAIDRLRESMREALKRLTV